MVKNVYSKSGLLEEKETHGERYKNEGCSNPRVLSQSQQKLEDVIPNGPLHINLPNVEKVQEIRAETCLFLAIHCFCIAVQLNYWGECS